MNYKEKLAPYIEKKWLSIIAPFLESEQGQKILNYLSERKKRVKILPDQTDMFNAFLYTPWDKVKIVILGQSPYHQIIDAKPEADGLAFSYKPKGIDLHIPRPLTVVRGEIEKDIYDGFLIQMDPDLTRWAEQGVLLLNSALTTEYNNADCHLDLWKPFTEYIIRHLDDYNAGVIFCLWGSHAKSFKSMINKTKHYVLEAAHPATELYDINSGGFYGCKHFSKINEILKNCNNEEIIW